MRRTNVLFALLLALGSTCLSACLSPVRPQPPPIVVPPRPTPVPPPIPIPPPQPPPPAPTPVNPDDAKPLGDIVAFEKAALVVPDAPRAVLVAAVGREPFGDRDLRDGTRSLRWPALGSKGDPKWLDVQVNAPDAADRSKDTVIGYSLVPRSRTK